MGFVLIYVLWFMTSFVSFICLCYGALPLDYVGLVMVLQGPGKRSIVVVESMRGVHTLSVHAVSTLHRSPSSLSPKSFMHQLCCAMGSRSRERKILYTTYKDNYLYCCSIHYLNLNSYSPETFRYLKTHALKIATGKQTLSIYKVQ